MTTIKESDASDLLANMHALAAEYDNRPQPGEFTIKQFAHEAHLGYDAAHNMLEKAIADGRVTKRELRHSVYFRFLKPQFE